MTELQARLEDLTADHKRKSQAFSLDHRCMGVREQLSKNNLRPKSEVCESVGASAIWVLQALSRSRS